MRPDPRPRGAAALVGVAAIGLTSAGWLDASPPALRAGLLLLGAWVVPAYLLVPFARRCGAASTAASASLSFFLVLSLHAIVSELLRAAGASFTTYDAVLTWMLLLSLLAVLAASSRRGQYREEWRALRATVSRHRGWWIAIVALCVIAAWSRGGFTVEEDAFDHIGFVRRIVDFNAMRPEHTLALPADAEQALPPDPRKGALHPMIAWITTTAGVPPDVAWSVLPLALYPALVFAFIAFTRTLAARTSLVVLAALLFMISYGGTALQFAHTSAYGQNLAAGWYWVLTAVTLGDARSRTALRGVRLAVLAVLAFGGVLAHVGVALHAAILAASLVAFAPWLGFSLKRSLIAGSVLAGAAGVGVITRLGLDQPTANIIHAHVQGVMFVGPDRFVLSPMEILRQFGMTYLGALTLVPFTAVAALRRSDARAVLALCAIPVMVAFVPPIATALYGKASYMLSRALLNAPVFVAAALALVGMVDMARRRGLVVRTAAALAIGGWAVVFVGPALDATRADLVSKRPALDESLRTLIGQVELLPGNGVVLSDPATSYLLSAHCSKPFVALYEQHGNPRDPYALERLQAVRDVLSPFADSQRAVEACQRFNVDYVVVNGRALTASPGFMAEWDPRLFGASCDRLGAIRLPFRMLGDESIVEARRYTIFEVSPGIPAQRPPDRAPPPVVAAAAEVVWCTVLAPDLSFEVSGVGVMPSTASTGDSVFITLGYRRDQATPFALPSLIHVRFDHERVVQAAPFIGDKYVRRYEERREGYVSRFRADAHPGRGVFEPDLWPMGTPLHETIPFVIPAHALPGHYQVEVGLVRDSLLPNFHVRDLLFNRDHYSGTPCGFIEVRAREQAAAQ